MHMHRTTHYLTMRTKLTWLDGCDGVLPLAESETKKRVMWLAPYVMKRMGEGSHMAAGKWQWPPMVRTWRGHQVFTTVITHSVRQIDFLASIWGHGCPISYGGLQDVYHHVLKGSVYQSLRAFGFEPVLYTYYDESFSPPMGCRRRGLLIRCV